MGDIMIKEINSLPIGGCIAAIASKSEAHRLLICAALGDKKTNISCPQTSKDIQATADCLCALGADITYQNGVYAVTPIQTPVDNAVLPCGESGSTLRFLIPLVCGLGVSAVFEMQGRLPERPLSPLQEELESHGIRFEKDGNRLSVGGKLQGNDFSIAANVSSQFISGLLFMLTRHGGTLTMTGTVESAAYIDMTVRALHKFNAALQQEDNRFTVQKGVLTAETNLQTEGDWSNAAFFLCAAAIGKKPITVTGLDLACAQGDKKIIAILKQFGAEMKTDKNSITVYPSALQATDIDAAQIPDLVPILAVTACAAKGTTRIYNAQRLRIKESDRLQTTADLLNTLGAAVTITEDGLLIEGQKPLHGALVDSANDHRIAMSAAVIAQLCDGTLKLDGADAVAKSYPAFWEDLEKLKGEQPC